MEAIGFVTNYPSYVETIKKVTKDEYLGGMEYDSGMESEKGFYLKGILNLPAHG